MVISTYVTIHTNYSAYIHFSQTLFENNALFIHATLPYAESMKGERQCYCSL